MKQFCTVFTELTFVIIILYILKNLNEKSILIVMSHFLKEISIYRAEKDIYKLNIHFFNYLLLI